MQHSTFNDFHNDTSCCFLTSTYNDFSMTQSGIYCVREQKNTKNTANKQTFHGHSSFALFLPLGRAKCVPKFSPQFLPSTYSYKYIYNRYNNEWHECIYNNNEYQSNIWSCIVSNYFAIEFNNPPNLKVTFTLWEVTDPYLVGGMPLVDLVYLLTFGGI